jgi:response regulator RpfG family c-di-GMP phosphodiesterase
MHDRRRKPRKLRTLIVDDRIDEATKLSQLLQAMGCDTAVAYGSASGVQMSKVFRPHLAFVDAHTSDAADHQLVSQLRETTFKPMLIAYPSTGAVTPTLEQTLAAAGVQRLIPTPMDPNLLADVLEECRAWWASSWCRAEQDVAQ